MVEERGRREKAESESIALRRKAEEVINAQREKEVAELKAQQKKVVAETNAAMLLSVSQLTKQQAETRSQQELECARLDRLRAVEEAETQILLANAREMSISLGGAISEYDRIHAEIERDTAIGVARELSKINVPSIIISGSLDSGQDVSGALMNMFLLKQMGIIPDNK